MQKVKLSDITTYITDGEHGSVHDTRSSFYLLSNKNLVDGRVFISDNERTICENDFNRIMNRIKIRRNSILISTVGQIGKIAIIDNDDINYVFQRSVGIINIDESKVNPYYVYLYLQLPTVQKYINFKSKGSNQKCLFIGDMGDLEIYLPSLEEQNQIVKNIKPMETKVILNNKINSELESLAKTIYDYWFLQFDFPNEEGKPYKSSGGAMEYNEELKMNIPKGWEVHKLGDLTTLDLGGTPKTEVDSYWNGDINWLNSGEVAQFPVVCTEAKITNEGMNNSATKMMKKGTVVVSITGNIRTSILGIDSCGNQSIVGIRETSQLKKSYIYPNICHLLDHYVHLSTGNCQQHINKETLLQTNIIVPPNRLLNKYYEIVEPMYEQIINNGNESFELTSLRDYLLPLLMNGQVGFKDE